MFDQQQLFNILLFIYYIFYPYFYFYSYFILFLVYVFIDFYVIIYQYLFYFVFVYNLLIKNFVFFLYFQKQQIYCDPSYIPKDPLPPGYSPLPNNSDGYCFHTEFSSNAFRAITAFCFMFLAVVQASYGYKVKTVMKNRYLFVFKIVFYVYPSFHVFATHFRSLSHSIFYSLSHTLHHTH